MGFAQRSLASFEMTAFVISSGMKWSREIYMLRKVLRKVLKKC